MRNFRSSAGATRKRHRWGGTLAPLLVALGLCACGDDRPRENALGLADGLGAGAAHPSGFAPHVLRRAEAAVQDAVVQRITPGAALALGRGARVALLRGYGRRSWDGGTVEADATVYDVASLTKVVATTAAVMMLVEDGRMRLEAPVRRYLPAFRGGARDRVTIWHLLTHTSGLPAGVDLGEGTPREARARMLRVSLVRAPGERSVYSDVGFATLWLAAERAAGEPLPALLRRRVYQPLGMRSTRFLHGRPCPRCAPSSDRFPASPARVHDSMARRLGGVAGHAGLFSTAADLSRFARMLLGGGELEGVRVFRTETVRRFTRRQAGSGTRALGWDTPNAARTSSAGTRMSMRSFGHTGHVGGSLWIDPDRRLWVVLLSNRTFNRATSEAQIQRLRRRVNDLAAQAVDAN